MAIKPLNLLSEVVLSPANEMCSEFLLELRIMCSSCQPDIFLCTMPPSIEPVKLKQLRVLQNPLLA